MSPTRRTVLASLGTAVLSAGCLASADSQDGDSGDSPRTEHPASPPDTPYPDSPTPRNRFADEPCPSFVETDQTVCAHSHGDSELSLEPSSQVFRPEPGTDVIETLTFTLYNDSDRPFNLNPRAWQVHRKESGQWSLVAPDNHVEPLSEVPAGESYEWVLSKQPFPTAATADKLYVTVDIEPGRHAFAIDGWVGSTGEKAEKKSVECLALFDVVDIVGE
ncbi:MAG: hypothetical protein V5A45_02570 [Haloarculaceae archaeon]